MSVVNFNGNLSTLHEHEATINAMARDWLEEAQQPIPDAMGGWGEVNTSRPPYYGLHAPSRMNKQPKDGDKPADHLLDNDSFDLLGLHDDDNTGGHGREQSGTSSEGRTLSTGRSYQPREDGMVYRQPDNPTRWSRRGSELPVIPEQNNPGPSSEGRKDAATPEGEKPQEGSGEAISYYNAETRKFRRREGHGPQRTARTQRIWDDWLSWRDAWRRGNQDQIKATAGDGGNQAAEGPGVGEPYGSGPRGKQHYRECPIASAP